jgi:hypothetical protein
MKIMIEEILKVFLWISIVKNVITYKAPDGGLEVESMK